MGATATGRAVEMNGLFIARIEDGRIAEEWSVGDSASLLQQLGVMEQ